MKFDLKPFSWLAASFLLVPIGISPVVAEQSVAVVPGCPPVECPACECAEDEKDPSEWEKSLAFGLNLTDGNSETILLYGNAKAFRDYQNNIWRFELSGNYGETKTDDPDDDETTQEDITADAEYKRLLSERVYAGMGATYLYDGVTDIDYRFTLKPVVGYFLIKEDDMRLSADIGPAYVFEEVGGVDDDYLAPRVSNRFEWDISETSKLFQTAEYLFDVDDSDNYIINATAGAEAALNSLLSLVVSVENSYDNIPAEGKDRNDLAVITALKVAI